MRNIGERGTGNNASNYISITETENSNTVIVKCMQPFMEQIRVVAALHNNSNTKAICICDYEQRYVYDIELGEYRFRSDSVIEYVNGKRLPIQKAVIKADLRTAEAKTFFVNEVSTLYTIQSNKYKTGSLNFVIEPTASAIEDETVNFAVSLIGDYKSEVTEIKIYSDGNLITTIEGGKNDGASNFYKEYSFIMPDGDVEIVVFIEKITVSEYYTLSYDTLGSGSADSIMVYMSDVAKAGEYMTVYIQLGLDEQEITISRVVLQNADTGEEIGDELEGYDGNYDFTMPACDVVIMIYLTSD